MSEQLQNDQADQEVIESAAVENQEIGSDLAPDSGSVHEEQPKVDEEAVKQEAINKAINKKHFEAQQAKRDLEAANQRIADFEAKQREQMAAQVGTIPDMPDSFDDDYEAKMKARDEAIIAQTNFNAQNQAFLQQQRLQEQQAQMELQQQLQQSVQSYNAKAKELGINQEELQAAGNTVAQYGLSDDLVKFILADTDGPLITKHLAANPQEGFNLAQMSPYAVGAELDKIRSKAASLKPKKTSAPAPSDDLKGAGAKPEGKYKNIGGAKFE